MTLSVLKNFPGKKHPYSATALLFASSFFIQPVIATDAALAGNERFNPKGQIQGKGWANLYDPVSNTLQVLPYVAIDNMAIYDGDIVLGTVSNFSLASPSPASSVQFGVAMNNLGRRWDDGIIFYDLNGHPDSNVILTGMADIEAETSIRFTARTNQQQYLKFIDGSGCWSPVGQGNGSQNISIESPGCRSSVKHEIFHALGVWHEQSRSDRDQFVTINFENIVAGMEGNFNIKSAPGNIDIGPYDYNSIMHYGRRAFSKNGLETITPPPGISIGNRSGLSQGDIRTIQEMYYTNLGLSLNTVAEADPGSRVQATINVTNRGDSTIGNIITKDVKITLPLPVQSSFNGSSSADNWICQQLNQNVECTIATLQRNADSSLVLDFTAPTSLNSMQLSPAVSASNRDIQPNNNSDTASIEIINLTDLSVDMKLSQASVDVGEKVTTILELGNPSQIDAQQISLNLTASAAMSYIGFSGTGWNCTNTDTTTICTLNSLASSAASQLTLSFDTISAVSDADISVAVSTLNTDGNPSNNSASTVLEINSPPPPPVPAPGTSTTSGSSTVSTSGGGASINLFFFVLCTLSILFGRNKSQRTVKTSRIQL